MVKKWHDRQFGIFPDFLQMSALCCIFSLIINMIIIIIDATQRICWLRTELEIFFVIRLGDQGALWLRLCVWHIQYIVTNLLTTLTGGVWRFSAVSKAQWNSGETRQTADGAAESTEEISTEHWGTLRYSLLLVLYVLSVKWTADDYQLNKLLSLVVVKSLYDITLP